MVSLVTINRCLHDGAETYAWSKQTIELDGLGPLSLRMAYTDADAGEPVLLLHGIPTWSFLYADVIPLLEPHCRVLAPDFLGHGWSDRRDRFDRSLLAQSDAILALLDALEIERATIVGRAAAWR